MRVCTEESIQEIMAAVNDLKTAASREIERNNFHLGMHLAGIAKGLYACAHDGQDTVDEIRAHAEEAPQMRRDMPSEEVRRGLVIST